MTGIDANVVLSFLTRDDDRLAAAADRFLGGLTADSAGHLSTVALVEVIWTLQRRFGLDRQEVVPVLRWLLGATEVRLERAHAVAEATEAFAAGGPGFGDHLIAALHREDAVDETVTFDRRASRLPGWRLLR